jgi:uroporphyrinogen decarboxylase
VTQALHGVTNPDTFHKHLAEHPDAVLKGLETINESNKEFMKAAVAEGCNGFFYGIAGRGGYWSRFNKKQLEEITLRLDRDALQSVDSELQMLHICNTLEENPEKNGGLMTSGWFKQYPVNIINWWDHHFVPIQEAKKVYKDTFCLAGGLDHKQTLMGSSEAIMAEAKQAIEAAGEGGGFILAGGCTVSSEAPQASYNAVGKAVELYGRYKK